MLELPGGLSIIKCGRVAAELELLHHFLGAAIFALKQISHEDLELNQLGRLIFVTAGRLSKQRLESITRLRIFLLTKRDIGQVKLRFAEF